LYFLCAHPALTPSSAVALTLRAVGGLTTRQIAQAYLVPEATVAQRISRAKRTVARAGLGESGDVATVLRVLYLVFNEGCSGDVDLAAEAIRLTRQLAAVVAHPEVAGLLALQLLHHARRPARTDAAGALVPLARQDRGRWDTTLVAEGVAVLQEALARARLGPFQAQAAIAALHADARRPEETDWVQIVERYDELRRLDDSPSSGSTGPSPSGRPTAGRRDSQRSSVWRTPSPASTPSPRTCTRSAATPRPPPTSTPRRRGGRRTRRNGTTSSGRRRG
jgi:predicted RNA polymerase sigma factor